MVQKSISPGSLRRLTGIPQNTLARWCADGILRPVGGKGRGNRRRFRIEDVIAAAAGVVYRREGADPGRVLGVVSLLASMPLERLEADLEAGRTFPVPGAMLGDSALPGFLIEPPKVPPEAEGLMKRLDLAAIVRDVKNRLELARRYAL